MRTVAAAALALGLLVGATGCGALDAHLGDAGGRVRVAAGFYPLAYVAERVGGNRVAVTNLTQPGAEPHDLELTIGETVDIARADLVVYEKGFQPAVDDSVAQNAEGATLDAGAVARLQDFPDSDQPDPHFWQDPSRLARVGDAVARELAAVDPAHAASYQRRAGRLRADLEHLDAAYRRGLADCARHTIVTSHDAFGYLEKYGVDVQAITGLSPGAEPTPGDLQRLQDLIRKEGITTVFSEELVSPKTADTLAHDLGITSRVLDPIEGLSDQTAHQDYLSLMRRNLRALEQANGCR